MYITYNSIVRDGINIFLFFVFHCKSKAFLYNARIASKLTKHLDFLTRRTRDPPGNSAIMVNNFGKKHTTAVTWTWDLTVKLAVIQLIFRSSCSLLSLYVVYINHKARGECQDRIVIRKSWANKRIILYIYIYL